jgi:hypothetical protein
MLWSNSLVISNLQYIHLCLTFSVFIMSTYALAIPASAGIVVTNDGNAILREIDIAHPAAKVHQMLPFSYLCILSL